MFDFVVALKKASIDKIVFRHSTNIRTVQNRTRTLPAERAFQISVTEVLCDLEQAQALESVETITELKAVAQVNEVAFIGGNGEI